MRENNKQKAAHTLIEEALKCNKEIAVSEVVKTLVTTGMLCESQSEPWKKAKAVIDGQTYGAMMSDFSSILVSNIVIKADAEAGVQALQKAAKYGDVGLTEVLKSGNKA